MHPTNLLEPWLLLRLGAGLVSVTLFARAAWTSSRVLRHFDVARATEGQLALERQTELAWALVRVATVLQVALLALSMLVGDHLAASIRGAMCGYGVFHATPWGMRSLVATVATALGAGIVAELYALDARVRGFDLVRPLAVATLALAPMAMLDFLGAAAFALDLDLSVVASCCSVRLDAVAAGAVGPGGSTATVRAIMTIGAVIAIASCVGLGRAAVRPLRVGRLVLSGAAACIALPLAAGAAIFEVAPYAFEMPQHVCPFCLLRASVFGLGYPLFGAILVAVVCGAGTAIGALLARSDASRAALASFARDRVRRQTFAWSLAIFLGVIPIARFAWQSGGLSLFR
jgi:hypothetical protein